MYIKKIRYTLIVEITTNGTQYYLSAILAMTERGKNINKLLNARREDNEGKFEDV
jgi:hypothetical protein